MTEKQNNRGTDITLSLLLVAFVVLKLCGVIDWPWIWVLAPVWIPLAIAAVALTVIFAVCGAEKIPELFRKWRGKGEKK